MIPEEPKRGSCGDWLLTWGAGGAPCHSRTDAPWRRELDAGPGRLWLQDATPSWAGGPWRELPCPEAEHGDGPTAGTPDPPTWRERLWLHGEIFGGEARAWALARGEERDPWGHYLLLLASEGDTWTVITDRYGTLHAYLAVVDGRVRALGSSFVAVRSAAGVQRSRLDWGALAGFFAHGFFPGDRTFHPEIRLLRPATRASIDPEGRMHTERWARWHHADRPAPSFDDAVDALAEGLGVVMGDLSRGNLAVPISGGLDSRSTVAALPPGRRPWTYSYGWARAAGRGRDPETRIAERIARARGLPFDAFGIGPYLFAPLRHESETPIRDSLDAVVAATEGFQDPLLPRQAAVWDRLRDFEAVIAAHWGDVWLDSAGFAEAGELLDDSELADLLLPKLRKPSSWLIEHLVKPHLGEDPETLLREQVSAELLRVGGIEETDFRAKAFKTEQWSWRWTCTSLRVFQAASFPRLPFYDPRLTELFSRLPASYLVGRRLQIEYLKRHAPDLARIPWQAYGANLWRYRHFHTWMLPERAAKKLWRCLFRGPAPERNWEVQLRGEGLQRLGDLLSSPGLGELVPASAITGLLQRFGASPTPALGSQVSMLLGFARWLELP
ncbi:MAG: hypothetical protein MI919_29255 [Holophagales bacterium]|nr:hypothetical protein [Holophagales bacterium]